MPSVEGLGSTNRVPALPDGLKLRSYTTPRRCGSHLSHNGAELGSGPQEGATEGGTEHIGGSSGHGSIIY